MTTLCKFLVFKLVLLHFNVPTNGLDLINLDSNIANISITLNELVSNNNRPSDLELQTLSELLLSRDANNAANQITINLQEKTTSLSKDDKAPQQLLKIEDSVYKIPTIERFIQLLDNYEMNALVNENTTPLERTEENAFIVAIMQTQVFRDLMTFFEQRGYVTPDPKQQSDFLRELWFTIYSRTKNGKKTSSAFERVFVSELNDGLVSGTHTWPYFAQEESANRVNYLGYLKYEQLGDKGAVLKVHYRRGTERPATSVMFVGTSPELEIALYSLCFLTRPDQNCLLKLGGKSVNIVTHTVRYHGRDMIGSAYLQI